MEMMRLVIDLVAPFRVGASFGVAACLGAAREGLLVQLLAKVNWLACITAFLSPGNWGVWALPVWWPWSQEGSSGRGTSVGVAHLSRLSSFNYIWDLG